MSQAPREQQRAQAAPASSQTTTQTTHPSTQQETPTVLRLRGARNPEARSVQWADDVVDNEGLGRKSSKVCCIYHKPKAVDESSDESSSDSSDSSDYDSDAGSNAKRAGEHKGHDHDCGHSHGGHRHGRRNNQNRDKKRPPSPNAYEKVPKPKEKPQGADSRSRT